MKEQTIHKIAQNSLVIGAKYARKVFYEMFNLTNSKDEDTITIGDVKKVLDLVVDVAEKESKNG